MQEIAEARNAPAPSGSLATDEDVNLVESALRSKIFRYERGVCFL